MRCFFFITANSLLKFLFLISVCTFISVRCLAQTPSDFPSSWQGRWYGEMEIYASGVLQQKIPMQLHILPTDSSSTYTYRIIYGTDTLAGDRPYLIKKVNAHKGWYVVDEQNSIKIESYLFGNILTSVYEVQGSFIFDILEKRGDTLYWRLFSGSNKEVSTTGDTKQGEGLIPAVKSYPVKVLQAAELKLKTNQ